MGRSALSRPLWKRHDVVIDAPERLSPLNVIGCMGQTFRRSRLAAVNVSMPSRQFACAAYRSLLFDRVTKAERPSDIVRCTFYDEELFALFQDHRSVKIAIRYEAAQWTGELPLHGFAAVYEDALRMLRKN